MFSGTIQNRFFVFDSLLQFTILTCFTAKLDKKKRKAILIMKLNKNFSALLNIY